MEHRVDRLDRRTDAMITCIRDLGDQDKATIKAMVGFTEATKVAVDSILGDIKELRNRQAATERTVSDLVLALRLNTEGLDARLTRKIEALEQDVRDLGTAVRSDRPPQQRSVRFASDKGGTESSTGSAQDRHANVPSPGVVAP